MKKIRRTTVALLTVLVSLVFVPVAFAHPLGNFTVNQYVGLKVSHEMILVDYVVDMAEIPAFQEIATLDANGNNQPDGDEFVEYAADKCTSLQPDLKLLLNNQALTPSLASSSVEFPAGVGGLLTLRLSCEYRVPVDLSQDNYQLSFTNNAFPDRVGWKEIVAAGADGVSLQGDYAATSVSNRLTSYPQDLLTSPLDQREVEVEITSTPLALQNATPVTAGKNNSPLLDRNDQFTRLILMDEITWPTLLLALGISFIWGAMHAMTPGHGKTIVGAYLVGSRGTLKHAVYLGLTTTITHTLGVFLLGMITLFAAKFILPEKLFPWISLLSGLFVVGIGVNLSVSRLRTPGLQARLVKRKPGYAQSHRAFTPVLEHSHADGLSHWHRHGLSQTTGHHHSHSFDHSSEDHHLHEHGHSHHNRDNHHEHSHTPPDALNWRSLLALGVSGGLLPCPSALVVLLGAIALNRIGLGLVLVLAFSLGLAGTLTAIGTVFIYAGKLFERFPARGKIIGMLPVFSALFISLIGVGIVVKALAEIGVV
jgi:nickel/cobalt transporter (NicO) family protein